MDALRRGVFYILMLVSFVLVGGQVKAFELNGTVTFPDNCSLKPSDIIVVVSQKDDLIKLFSYEPDSLEYYIDNASHIYNGTCDLSGGCEPCWQNGDSKAYCVWLNSDGNFTLRNIQSGNYTVFAIPPDDGCALGNYTRLELLGNQTVSISLVPAKTITFYVNATRVYELDNTTVVGLQALWDRGDGEFVMDYLDQKEVQNGTLSVNVTVPLMSGVEFIWAFDSSGDGFVSFSAYMLYVNATEGKAYISVDNSTGGLLFSSLDMSNSTLLESVNGTEVVLPEVSFLQGVVRTTRTGCTDWGFRMVNDESGTYTLAWGKVYDIGAPGYNFKFIVPTNVYPDYYVRFGCLDWSLGEAYVYNATAESWDLYSIFEVSDNTSIGLVRMGNLSDWPLAFELNCTCNETIIDIPDDNLKHCVIVSAYGIDENTTLISKEFASEFEGLGCDNASVESLIGIGNFTNLKTLSLSQNNITDISPLANLTNLKELYLWGNQIDNVTALGNLTNLEVLVLSQNNITDISPLANLTNLKELYLWGNPVLDYSPIKELTVSGNLTCYGCPAIWGRVFAENGTPASGVVVKLISDNESVSGEVVTDEYGVFRFFGNEAGSYRLAFVSDVPIVNATWDIISDAYVVEGLEVTNYLLAGHVNATEAGFDCSNVTLVFYNEILNSEVEVPVNATTCDFEVELPGIYGVDNVYKVFYYIENYPPMAVEPVDVAIPSDNVTLTLRRSLATYVVDITATALVEGCLKTENGTGVAGIPVQIFSDNVANNGACCDPYNTYYSDIVLTDENGCFSVKVRPGFNYSLSVGGGYYDEDMGIWRESGWPLFYYNSTAEGGVVPFYDLRERFEVPEEGMNMGSLVLPEYKEVDVCVKDWKGQPIPGLYVTAEPVAEDCYDSSSFGSDNYSYCYDYDYYYYSTVTTGNDGCAKVRLFVEGANYTLGVGGCSYINDTEECYPFGFYSPNGEALDNGTIIVFTQWSEAPKFDLWNEDSITLVYPKPQFITGVVRGAEDICVSNDWNACWIDVYSSETGEWSSAKVDPNTGNFTIRVFSNAKDYKLYVNTPSLWGYFYDPDEDGEGSLVKDWSLATDLSANSRIEVNLSGVETAKVYGEVVITNYSGDESCYIWIDVWSPTVGGSGYGFYPNSCGCGDGSPCNCTFEISDLMPADDYVVSIWPSDSCGLSGGYYDGSKVPNLNSKSVLSLKGGDTVRIVFTLEGNKVFSISGAVSVRGLETNKMYHLYVNALGVSKGYYGVWDNTTTSNSDKWTNNFSIRVPADEYRVCADLFEVNGSQEIWVAGKCYNNATSWEKADPVDVSSGNATNIDISIGLETLKEISGSIKLNGISDCSGRSVWVNIWSDSTGNHDYAEVRLDDSCEGNYTLKVPEASDYRMWVDLWSIGLPGGFVTDGCVDNDTTTSCELTGDYNQAAVISVSDDLQIEQVVVGEEYSELNGTLLVSGVEDGYYDVWIEAYSIRSGDWGGEYVHVNVVNGTGEASFSLKLPKGEDYVVWVDSSSLGFPSGYLTENGTVSSNWSNAYKLDLDGSVSKTIRLDIADYGVVNGTITVNTDDTVYVSIQAECYADGLYSYDDVIVPGGGKTTYKLVLEPCSGTYSIKVYASGNLKVSSVDGYVNKVSDLDSISVEKGQSKKVNITLGEGLSIEGTVKAEGNGLEGAFVEVMRIRGDNTIEFYGWDVTDENGEFSIGGLDEGNYTLLVVPPYGSEYVTKMKSGIEAGSSSVAIELEKGVSITGQVTVNGRGYPGVDVWAWSDNGTDTWIDDVFAWTFSGDNGTYTLKGLAKGTDTANRTYVICAHDLSGRFSDDCKIIEVAANGTVYLNGKSVDSLNFTLSSGHVIYGYVSGTGYDPVRDGGQIAVIDNSTEEVVAVVSVHPDGSFATPALDDGNYTLEAWIKGFEGNATVSLSGDDNYTVITVEAVDNMTISGTIAVNATLVDNVYRIEVVAAERDVNDNATGVVYSEVLCEGVCNSTSETWSMTVPIPEGSYTVCVWAYNETGQIINSENCTSDVTQDNGTDLKLFVDPRE